MAATDLGETTVEPEIRVSYIDVHDVDGLGLEIATQMTLEVKKLGSIKEANENQWNHIVEQSNLSCIYHRYEWLRAVEVGTSHEPRHLLVSKNDNPIGICPNFVTDLGPIHRLTSLRPGYGGPITMTDETATLDLLLESVPDICTGTVILNELRTYDECFVRYHDVFKDHGYKISLKECRFPLDLTQGWESLFDGMDSERRRGIRRGHDNEFDVVDEAVTERTLSAFYEGYATVMSRIGTEKLPWSFVRELIQFDDRVKLFSLYVDGNRRGMYMYLLDDEQSTLQHLFSAVTEEHFEYYAAELLHEHTIKWGIDNGYETYELRGAVPDFRDGVFRFKEGFGAEATPLLTWERGCPTLALPVLEVGRLIEERIKS
ncbi:peptidoglycan bridge formation glycyltransferase FemA/FemB family protein [Halomontanus rarus]|uniref:peptidoglycan bridge formation glycyltransferase FemA/FemB family protein n=1 Tax=Halomontanus rarus TaxID=3034020 RepID=UPI001F6112A6